MKSNLRSLAAVSAFFLFITIVSNAQEGDVYVGIAGGLSIPLSDYASTDFDNESSGFARNGGNFNIQFGYRFNEYISLTGMLNGCVNRYDYVELQNWLTDQYAGALPDTRWVVETKSWGQGGLMAGATGSLPLVTNRLFLEARILGGLLYAYSPAIYVTGVEDGEEDKTLNIEQSNAPSWVVDAGAGFRWNRTRNQYFMLYADYMTARPSFNNVRLNTNFGIERDDAFSQQMNTVNISIGIGYIVN